MSNRTAAFIGGTASSIFTILFLRFGIRAGIICAGLVCIYMLATKIKQTFTAKQFKGRWYN